MSTPSGPAVGSDAVERDAEFDRHNAGPSPWPEPWKQCPSTHCERRQECAGPRDCLVRKPPPLHEQAKHHGRDWAVWWQGSGERGDHIMESKQDGFGYARELAWIGDQHHDQAGVLVAEHNEQVRRLREVIARQAAAKGLLQAELGRIKAVIPASLSYEVPDAAEAIASTFREYVKVAAEATALRNAAARPIPDPAPTDAAGRPVPEWFPHPATDLDKMAVALLVEFRRVEPDHAISRNPASWVATFVDLARVAIAAQRPAPAEDERQGDLEDLRRLSEAATQGRLWAAAEADYREYPTDERWCISEGRQNLGCEVSKADALFWCRVVNDFRAGRLVPPAPAGATGLDRETMARISIDGILALLDHLWTYAATADERVAFADARDLLANYREEAEERIAATNGAWTAWSEDEADSDPSDPLCGHATVWYVGWWRKGAPEADCATMIGGPAEERRARGFAADLNRLLALSRPASPGAVEVTYPPAELKPWPHWDCPACHRCKSYAQVDERKPGGGFGPGPLIRCVECKAVFDTRLPTAPAPDDGCILCCNGADLPEGEYCRACGRVKNESPLERAIRKVEGTNRSPTTKVAFASASTAPAPDAVAGLTLAARDVLAERRRQVEAEGWTPEHDDEHTGGELARAAASYALQAGLFGTWLRTSYQDRSPEYRVGSNPIWPWSLEWWKPVAPRHDLIKAGALIFAEIERLDRAALAAPAASGTGA